MSYLDFPRIHFTGGFQAAPSTVNNAPLNYKEAIAPGVQPWDLDSWWNAYGNGVFNLNQCAVSSAQLAIGSNDSTLVGQEVFAAFTSSPPKIADLDPMQQNVSEWWGLTLQVGLGGSGGKLVGNFAPIAFNNIWAAADGAKYGSAAGAGVYQSTLTNAQIQAGNSPVLERLAETARAGSALSVRIQVRAYNGRDSSYDLTSASLQKLRGGPLAPLPDDVWTQLQTISKYEQGAPATTPPGVIVATQFLHFLLQRWLGQAAAAQWGELIGSSTKIESSESPVGTAFTYGKLVGTIGPAATDEPRFFAAKRMMAPTAAGKTNFAPFQLAGDVLSVDLSNALQTDNPATGPITDYGQLGVYFADGSEASTAQLPYGDYAAFLEAGGIVDLQLQPAAAKKAADTALYIAERGSTTPLLAENDAGLWMRADQFVFRMNPGTTPSDPHLSGNSATLEIPVRKFGAVPPDGSLRVKLTMLTPEQSYTYTNSTIGTGGTPGLDAVPMGTPATALSFEQSVPVHKGIARFTLEATDPGNPREFIDGQIYFLRYVFEPPVSGYQQGADDLVSVLVFQNTVVQGEPTWANSIGEILGQYGRLYPIMARFGLTSHEQVKVNAEQIADVLERAYADPFHMPVTRDLSESRRQLILKWMASGMP
ncbi:MAG: hypothetical protein OEZ06_00950 [Myxococcales bacterium]|nr:hypothetical protein [Myxococcales bacterium]